MDAKTVNLRPGRRWTCRNTRRLKKSSRAQTLCFGAVMGWIICLADILVWTGECLACWKSSLTLEKILFKVPEKVRRRHNNLHILMKHPTSIVRFDCLPDKNCGLLIIRGMFASVSMTQRCMNWRRNQRTGMLRLGRRSALRWNSAPGTIRPGTSFSSSAMVGHSVLTEIQTQNNA